MGILGLINAFGRLMGEDAQVELVSANPISDELRVELYGLKAHFFLIGSPKVNKMTEGMLDDIQINSKLKWVLREEENQPKQSLQPCPKCEREFESNLDYELWRIEDGAKPVAYTPIKSDPKIPGVYYGLIVRGPFDKNDPHRICTVLAGPQAVGTAAACLAATRSILIEEIRRKLGTEVDLADPSKPIWVLVSGQCDINDGHLKPENVKIIEAGGYG